jgi:predicted NUDIX family NTP pyrophosphohydrolase
VAQAKRSAGILLFRITADGSPEVMIAHMGGPFWARKDNGAWSIPKGEVDSEVDGAVDGEGDDPMRVALREFEEEIGRPAPDGDYRPLGDFRQRSGKVVTAYALEADIDVSSISSNTFGMEWPKGSGRIQQFPEIDRAGWFSVDEAREKLVKGQVPILDALLAGLD